MDWVTPKKRFRYEQFTVSKDHPSYATQLRLTKAHKDTIRLGVESILDPLLAEIGGWMKVTSGYRDSVLNGLVGGSRGSDHLDACAADIVASVGAQKIFSLILLKNLPFRQLVGHLNFVHVSWNIPGRRYKHQAWLAA